MIEFTAKQLSWLVISAATLGGGGYVSMNTKVDEIDKKVAVTNNSLQYTEKSLNEVKTQLDRIEEKISKEKSDK